MYGKPASPGIAIGKAFVLGIGSSSSQPLVKNSEPPQALKSPQSIDAHHEWGKFKVAVQEAKIEINSVLEKSLSTLGPEKAAIFESHLMILEDPEMLDLTKDRIFGKGENCSGLESAFSAYTEISEFFIITFEAMKNEYMRERAHDVKDVSRRVLRKLSSDSMTEELSIESLTTDVIVVAHDLTPSETATMDRNHVLGFVTNIGGKTSHTAILARTLEIPAVLGLESITQKVVSGDVIALDGENGEVYINPSQEVIALLQEKKTKLANEKAALACWVGKPSVTKDGRSILLTANLGTVDDLPLVLKNDAEGVGLFRTEFLFMGRNSAPTEEEQFRSYKTVLETMKGKPVVIRTLDIGGDKEVPYLNIKREANPFLGLRAIRYCLQTPALFKTQLRALLRASSFGKLEIMIPMISCLHELTQSKILIEEVRLQLISEGIKVSPHIKIGIMIEIPAAALIADVLAQHCDFFSIGTNDLIQYTCAVDRMNQSIHQLYDPSHLGVRRLIAMTVNAAKKAGIPVAMCGEMAGTAEFLSFLLGVGLDELSMSPSSLLRTRMNLAGLSFEDSTEFSNAILS